MIQELANRLRRVTSSGRFVPEIDGLRFLAIMLVVAFHSLAYLRVERPMFADPLAAGPLERVVATGYFGVELFFVISGFILALPFASHHLTGTNPVRLGRFLERRLTRLEPPYIVSLLVLAAAWLVVRHAPFSWVATHLPAHIFYVHSFLLGAEGGLSNVTWSLEIEVQFYLLTPLLSKVFAINDRLLRRGTLLAAMLAVGMFSEMQHLNGAIRSGPPHLLLYLQFFLSGMLLADVYLTDWKSRPERSPIADVVGLSAFAAVFLMVSTHTLEYALAAPLLLIAYGAVFRGPRLRTLFSYPMITAIGGMCYTIYLYHNAIIWVTAGALKPLQIAGAPSLTLFLNILVLASATVLASIPCYLAIERPFMRSRSLRGLFGKAPPVQPAADPKQ